MAENTQTQKPEDFIGEKFDALDPSKARGAAAALGAGAVFGPVGALLGLGVYALSRKMHKGELEAALADYRMGHAADTQQAGDIEQLFAGEMTFDQELYNDPRVTDIDRRQHAMIADRFLRAKAGMNHADPAVRRQAISDMNVAAEQRSAWLEDIESRTETLGDEELRRERKLADDLLAHQRDLHKQSIAFEQQWKLQSERERVATERALLMDNIQTIKDAYRGKSAAVRDTDTLLATLAQESEIDPTTGRRVLTSNGRAALESAVELRVNETGIGGVLSAAGQGAKGTEVGAILGALGKSFGTLKAYTAGENVNDQELIELAEALDRAQEEHFDNIIKNTQPAIKRQAELAGAESKTALAGVTFELTEQQKEWRKLYKNKWDTDRTRQVRARPGATPSQGGDNAPFNLAPFNSKGPSVKPHSGTRSAAPFAVGPFKPRPVN